MISRILLQLHGSFCFGRHSASEVSAVYRSVIRVLHRDIERSVQLLCFRFCFAFIVKQGEKTGSGSGHDCFTLGDRDGQGGVLLFGFDSVRAAARPLIGAAGGQSGGRNQNAENNQGTKDGTKDTLYYFSSSFFGVVLM